MKTRKILSAAALAGMLILPALALAQEPPGGGAPTVVTSGEELITLITRIGNWVFAVLLAVAGFMLLYAAFKWVTAGGSPEEVNKARLMLMNALIGVAVALLARGLVQVIRTIIAPGQ